MANNGSVARAGAQNPCFAIYYPKEGIWEGRTLQRHVKRTIDFSVLSILLYISREPESRTISRIVDFSLQHYIDSTLYTELQQKPLRAG